MRWYGWKIDLSSVMYLKCFLRAMPLLSWTKMKKTKILLFFWSVAAKNETKNETKNCAVMAWNKQTVGNPVKEKFKKVIDTLFWISLLNIISHLLLIIVYITVSDVLKYTVLYIIILEYKELMVKSIYFFIISLSFETRCLFASSVGGIPTPLFW